MEADHEALAAQFIERLPEVRAKLAEDVEAAFEGDPAAKSFGEIVVAYPSIHAIAIYRLAHELRALGVLQIPRIMAEHAHARTGIDINPGAKIGRRFFIDHGTGVVIGETSEIGDRVRLYHGVTLGAFSPRRGQTIRGTKRHPTIERRRHDLPGRDDPRRRHRDRGRERDQRQCVRDRVGAAGLAGGGRAAAAGDPPQGQAGARPARDGLGHLRRRVSRSRRLAAALVTALALAAGAAAEEPAGWAYDLAHELMSPYCPGRALAECPSPQADALRLWILEQARAGATREEVEAQLLQSFGDRLLQTPRAEGVGLVAYAVPALLVVGGAALLALFLRRQS